MDLKGFVKVDFDPNTNPDVLHNLNNFPYPFSDDTFDFVVAHHIIEHLPNYKPFLDEIVRVCKDGAKFDICYPHYLLGFIIPVHLRGYGLNLFMAEPSFKVSYRRLEWDRSDVNKGLLHRSLNKVINAIVNKNTKNMFLAERLGLFGGFMNVIQRGVIDKKAVCTSEVIFNSHDILDILPYGNDKIVKAFLKKFD